MSRMFCDSCFFNIWSRIFTVQDIIYWRHRSSDGVNSWYHVWITFHVDFQTLHKRTCNPSHHSKCSNAKYLISIWEYYTIVSQTIKIMDFREFWAKNNIRSVRKCISNQVHEQLFENWITKCAEFQRTFCSLLLP